MARLNFTPMKKNIEKYDSLRDELIKKSRDLLRVSKKLIYDVHRNSVSKQNLDAVKKEKKNLDAIAKKDKGLSFEGSYSEANQEYVEALTFYSFVKDGGIPSDKTLKVNERDYLLGICDLTGELARRAVLLSIENKTKEVKKIRDFVDNIQGEMIKFNLRNSNLRRKYDAIKYNLSKIEDLLLKLK